MKTTPHLRSFSRNARGRLLGLLISSLVLALPAGSLAHENLKAGFNIFSEQQDVEIGRSSAAEVRKELPILVDDDVNRYTQELVERLTTNAPGPRFTYRAQVADVSDINAFALPGGYLFVNRGLIQAARTEGQLAGVLAHEVAHIALRHGTHQASKAYLAQAGLSLLGGLFGKGESRTGDIVAALGGFGMNALFLKYSRDAESEADALGARLMASAGYDPNEMADFFDVLRAEQARDPSKLEQFFSDHPSPGDRSAHIRREAGGLPRGPSGLVGNLAQVKAELRTLPPAPSMQMLAQGYRVPPSDNGRETGSVEVAIERPSSNLRTFVQKDRFFSIRYPANWRVYASRRYGVTIAPRGGVVNVGGDPVIVYGAIVNHYEPFDRSALETGASLEDATRDIIGQIQKTDPHLKEARDSWRRQTVSERPALSVVLSGRSPYKGKEESIVLFTRLLPDEHVIYALFIAPRQDFAALVSTYSSMISSVRVNERARHD